MFEWPQRQQKATWLGSVTCDWPKGAISDAEMKRYEAALGKPVYAVLSQPLLGSYYWKGESVSTPYRWFPTRIPIRQKPQIDVERADDVRTVIKYRKSIPVATDSNLKKAAAIKTAKGTAAKFLIDFTVINLNRSSSDITHLLSSNLKSAPGSIVARRGWEVRIVSIRNYFFICELKHLLGFPAYTVRLSMISSIEYGWRACEE